MFKNKLKARILAVAAGLAAVSAVVQLVHIGYQSPQWGMWIDIVAVTWIIALLLYGLRIAFIVSLIGAIVITLFAPDTWLGASMKWLASAPIWVVLGWWVVYKKKSLSYFKKAGNLILPGLIGIAIRCIFVIPVNYYYAIPIWTKMSPEQAMAAIPWYIITLFNIAQSALDIALAWLLVYHFRLDRYAKHSAQD